MADYATPEELEVPAQTVPLDILDAHLHSFFVAYSNKIKTVSRATTLPSISGYLLGGAGEITGISVATQTLGTAGTIDIYDGPDANGRLLGAYRLTAGALESLSVSITPPVRFERSLYAVIQGDITGAIYTTQEIAL